MTKEEVRAISLDKLELHRAKRMLDVGSGTGSVTIQAARTYPELEVVAVERNEDAVALTQENIQHFGCHNVRLHQGLAPIELEGSLMPFLSEEPGAICRRFSTGVPNSWSREVGWS